MIVFYWDQPFQVCWVVSSSIGNKPFSVGLVAQLFQPALNWVETVQKALVAAAVVFAGPKNCYLRVTCVISPRTGRLHGSLVMTIPRSDRVSNENGWESVLLENVNCVNLNHFPLNRLIPIQHDLSFDKMLLTLQKKSFMFSMRSSHSDALGKVAIKQSRRSYVVPVLQIRNPFCILKLILKPICTTRNV